MVKPSKGAILRAVDPKVVELVEASSEGDVRKVRKLVTSGKVEIDDGEPDSVVHPFEGRSVLRYPAMLTPTFEAQLRLRVNLHSSFY